MRIFILIVSILLILLVASATIFLFINAPVNKDIERKAENLEVLYSDKPDANRLSIKAKISFGSVRISESEDENLALAIYFKSSLENLNPNMSIAEESGELLVDYDASQTIGKIFDEASDVAHDIKIGGPSYPRKLKLDLGAGEIILNAANPTLINAAINAGAGNIVVDYSSLSGKEGKINVNIDLGVGKITVIIPGSSGLKYNLGSGIGTVNFGSRDDSGFGNVITGISDGYAESELQFDLKLNTGIGQVLIIEK